MLTLHAIKCVGQEPGCKWEVRPHGSMILKIPRLIVFLYEPIRSIAQAAVGTLPFCLVGFTAWTGGLSKPRLAP